MAELLCGSLDWLMGLRSVWAPPKQQHINGSEQHSHKKTNNPKCGPFYKTVKVYCSPSQDKQFPSSIFFLYSFLSFLG